MTEQRPTRASWNGPYRSTVGYEAAEAAVRDQ